MDRRGTLSLGEMTMFATYFLVGTFILAAAVNIYNDVYPLSIDAKLRAACNSVVEILDTAYSTGLERIDVSKEIELLGAQGIKVRLGESTSREVIASLESNPEQEETCYTHAAPNVGLLTAKTVGWT